MNIGSRRLRGGFRQILFHRAAPLSAIFKQRGAVAAQNKVEAVGQTIQRYGGVHVQLGDQRAHGVVILNSPDDRALLNQRVAFKIHLGDQALGPGVARERKNGYAPDASRWPGCARGRGQV